MDSAGPESTFADRLNHLVARVHPANRGPYTDDEIATAVGVSAQAVRYWRHGRRMDPKMGNLQRLAKLFGVPVAYFFDDALAERLDAELALLTALREQGVRQIALRAAGLSPQSQQTIVEVVRQIRQLEGLAPDVPVPDEEASG
jgi:transcriptional regulator with XRE-family HTH domain